MPEKMITVKPTSGIKSVYIGGDCIEDEQTVPKTKAVARAILFGDLVEVKPEQTNKEGE